MAGILGFRWGFGLEAGITRSVHRVITASGHRKKQPEDLSAEFVAAATSPDVEVNSVELTANCQLLIASLYTDHSMVEAAKTLVLIVSALFPIVNPLGGSPIFLARTSGYPSDARRGLAQKISVNSFFLLVGSYFIGTYILEFFGISLPVVQVGGGLIVISTGWTMLKQGGDERQELHHGMQPQDLYDQAFYPLTLPLTVGPGSISVAITLGANTARHHPVQVLATAAALIASALIALSVYLCYAFADRLARVLGTSGMSVMMRLSSFLLVCIGVQIVWNGASALLAASALHGR